MSLLTLDSVSPGNDAQGVIRGQTVGLISATGVGLFPFTGVGDIQLSQIIATKGGIQAVLAAHTLTASILADGGNIGPVRALIIASPTIQAKARVAAGAATGGDIVFVRATGNLLSKLIHADFFIGSITADQGDPTATDGKVSTTIQAQGGAKFGPNNTVAQRQALQLTIRDGIFAGVMDFGYDWNRIPDSFAATYTNGQQLLVFQDNSRKDPVTHKQVSQVFLVKPTDPANTETVVLRSALLDEPGATAGLGVNVFGSLLFRNPNGDEPAGAWSVVRSGGI